VTVCFQFLAEPLSGRGKAPETVLALIVDPDIVVAEPDPCLAIAKVCQVDQLADQCCRDTHLGPAPFDQAIVPNLLDNEFYAVLRLAKRVGHAPARWDP
jgi:hypothetical protein